MPPRAEKGGHSDFHVRERMRNQLEGMEKEWRDRSPSPIFIRETIYSSGDDDFFVTRGRDRPSFLDAEDDTRHPLVRTRRRTSPRSIERKSGRANNRSRGQRPNDPLKSSSIDRDFLGDQGERIIVRDIIREPGRKRVFVDRITDRSPSADPQRRVHETRAAVGETRVVVERERDQERQDYDETSLRQHIDRSIWDVTKAKDVTIHLELDIAEDLELELEEFNRLDRLGHFKAAKQYFSSHLAHASDDPYIAVQYASMLLRMGDYRSIQDLPTPPTLRNPESSAMSADMCAIKMHGKMHSGEASKDELEDYVISTLMYTSAGESKNFSRGSTECHAASLAYQIAKYSRLKEVMEFNEVPWKAVYSTLLRQGRIWDLGDLLVSTYPYYGQAPLQKSIWPGSLPRSIPDMLISDWLMTQPDEVTEVALLDVVVTLMIDEMLAGANWYHVREPRHDDMNIADQLVSLVTKNNPAVLESRQYIRWAILKVALKAQRRTDADDLLSKLPGPTLQRPQNPFQLPILAPKEPGEEEIECPALFTLPPEHLAALRMLVKAAHDQEDYRTEVLGLTLKISVTQDRDRLEAFQDLTALQSTKQGDKKGLLATNLSRYTMCKDPASRDSIRSELALAGKCEILEPILAFARFMILGALARNEKEGKLCFEEARRVKGLRQWIYDYMDLLGHQSEKSTNTPQTRTQKLLGQESKLDTGKSGPETHSQRYDKYNEDSSDESHGSSASEHLLIVEEMSNKSPNINGTLLDPKKEQAPPSKSDAQPDGYVPERLNKGTNTEDDVVDGASSRDGRRGW